MINASFIDGENIRQAKTVPGENITAPTFKKAGYALTGWKSPTGAVYAPGDSISIDADAEFAAVWTPVKYSITYQLNGGTNGSNPASYTIESDVITLSPAVKSGETFLAWVDEEGNAITKIPAGSYGDITLYAKWQHDLVYHAAVESTCSKEGSIACWECTGCGEMFLDEAGTRAAENIAVAKKEHTWDEGEITKETTCAEPGTQTFHCTVCGEEKTETIATTAHTLIGDRFVFFNDQFCLCYTCTVCGKHFADKWGNQEIEIQDETQDQVQKSQTVNLVNKTFTVKAKKKKVQVISSNKVTRGNLAQTFIIYSLLKANKKKSYFKVASGGKITIKKKLPKGTYKLYIRGIAIRNRRYYASSATFVVTIKAK